MMTAPSAQRSSQGPGRRRPSLRRGRSAHRLLGAWLALTLLVAFLLLGGVHPEHRALLHGMVGAGLAGAALLPVARLEHSGWALRWGAASAAVLLSVAAGLVVLPASVLQVLAPGIRAARPADAWSTLSLVPEATVGQLATWSLVLGYGLLVCVWGGARQRRHLVEGGVVVGVGVLVILALVHALTGAQQVLGVLPVDARRDVLFGPLVNPNHLGATLLLGLPIVLGQALDRPPGRDLLGFAAASVLVAAFALLLLMTSTGARFTAFLLVVVMSALPSPAPRWARSLLGFGGVAGMAWTLLSEAWYRDSMVPRLQLWWDVLSMGPDFWFAGAGAGTFVEAARPYRLHDNHLTFHHAHNDLMEWVLEGGLVGLMALVVVLLALWPPRKVRDPVRAGRLSLGLASFGLYALLEFPLQIPAIAMAVAALIAARGAIFAPEVRTSAVVIRGMLFVAGLLQLGGGLWQARMAAADAAVVEIRARPGAAAEAAESLSRLAPWRPEVLLHAAWAAERAGDGHLAAEHALSVERRHPEDASALRRAALVLGRDGRHDDAIRLLERALVRAPGDQRNHVALARAHQSQGDLDRALSAWGEALRRRGPHATVGEAYALLPLGLYWAEALKGGDAVQAVRLARLLHQEGDHEAALLAFEEAVLVDADHWAAHPLRGRLLRAAGRLDEAKAHLEAHLARNPTDTEGLLYYAELLEVQGRHEEASDAFLAASDGRGWVSARAIRSAAAAGGEEAGLRLVRRLDLEGGSNPAVGLEAARLRRAQGDGLGCVREIEERALLDSAAVSAQARVLLEDCSRPQKGRQLVEVP